MSRDIILRRAAYWTVSNGELSPIPGSWIIPTSDSVVGLPEGVKGNFPPSLLALCCCPKCRQAFGLVRGSHNVDVSACRVSPDWMCGACGTDGTLYLDRFYQKTIYAMSYIHKRSQTVKHLYCQADNVVDAKRQFGASAAHAIGGHIAPAIGFFIHGRNPDDAQGELLSADAPPPPKDTITSAGGLAQETSDAS